MSRYALVTGAAGDLGSAACVALAGDGWSLFITDHPAQAQRLQATHEACVASGVEIVPATFDVTDPDAVDRHVGMLAERHGVPTALVAGAGIQGDFAPVHDYDVDVVRRVLDVNVVGVFNAIKVTAALMIRAGTGGSIIATASMAGVSGAPNMPAYVASKAAVIGLAKGASRDLAPHGIRVNAVCPGGTITPYHIRRAAGQGVSEAELRAQRKADNLLGRWAEPREVAFPILFLASDESSYVTGATLMVDAGRSIL